MAKKVLIASDDPEWVEAFREKINFETNRECDHVQNVKDAIEAIDSREYMGTFVRGLSIPLGGLDSKTIKPFKLDPNYSGGAKIIRYSLEKGLKTLYIPIEEDAIIIRAIRKIGSEVFSSWHPEDEEYAKRFKANFAIR